MALLASVLVVQPGAASANHAGIYESPFEIDGNTPVTTTWNTDWATAPGLDVINDQNYTLPATVVANPDGTGCQQTPEGIYTNNSKVDAVPRTQQSGQAPDKIDLCQVYIGSEFLYTPASTVSTPDHPGGADACLYLAWHRRTNTGSAVVWWELNQGTTLDAGGFTVRQQGDLLIGFDFQAATPVIYYTKWNAATNRCHRADHRADRRARAVAGHRIERHRSGPVCSTRRPRRRPAPGRGTPPAGLCRTPLVESR